MQTLCSGSLWQSLPSDEKSKRLLLNAVEEEAMFTRSLCSYENKLDACLEANTPATNFIYKTTDILSDSIMDYLSKVQRTMSWMQPINDLGPDVLSVVIVGSLVRVILFNDVDGLVEYQDIIRRIASDVVKHAELKAIRKDNKGAWVIADRAVKHNWTKKRIDQFIKHHRNKGGKIKQRDALKFAAHMIEILAASGLITVSTVRYAGNDTRTYITFSDDVLSGLEKAHADFLVWAKILYRPMIVPPISHTVDVTGGVHTEYLRKSLVLGDMMFWVGEEFSSRFRLSKPSQEVVDGLNRLMSTEWTVNGRVLEVIDTLFKSNSRVANLPPYEKDDLLSTRVSDESVLEETLTEKRLLWDEWHKRSNDRFRMLLRLSLARDLQSYGFFYHAYTVDFRSRAYTTTDLLSPQSGDHDRSLILFAKPVKQTERGLYWLKVTVANLFDQDKKSFSDRVKWVDDNMGMLRSINDDPYSTLHLWADDKKKKNQSFQRLAAVFELFRTDGMTQLPVNMDGSCNGIQHWAAISRDPIIGKLVNLVPSDEPQDAYAYVANMVTVELEKNVYNDPWADVFLSFWDGKVSRSVVKRAVMTDPYGVTLRGIIDGLLDDGHLDWVPAADKVKAANALAKYVQQAMNILLTIPNQGKQWLKSVCELACSSNKHLKWTTPCGFTVAHEYTPFERIELNIDSLTSTRRKYVFAMYKRNEVDKLRAMNGISPNTIHSLDASHMYRTINAGARECNMSSFSFIHDSYGVYATEVDDLRRLTKREFVSLHASNPLQAMKEELEEYLGIELPPVPPVGELDINQVMESEYFFH
jgi:DNA-directed RNA polymerase